MADLKFTADYTDLSKTVDVLIKIGKASNDTATAFAQAARQIVSWQEKFAVQQGRVNAALETNYQKQQLANKSAKDSASVFQQQAAAIQQNADALVRFRASYDPVYSAEQKYLQLTNLLRQALANKTITWSEAREELTRYKQALAAAGHAQTGFGKTMNRTGVLTQQAGYQVGDFLVQVQSGTNPMVAFGQQATQLVGALYYLPPATLAAKTSIMGLSVSLGGMLPIIGIALPLITAFGAAWMRTRRDVEDSSKSVDTLKQSLDSLTSTYEDWDRARRAAIAGVTVDEFTAAENVRQAREEYEALRVKAIEAFQAIERADGTWDNAKAQEHKRIQEEAAEAAKTLAEAEQVAANIQNKAGDDRIRQYEEGRAKFSEILAGRQKELELAEAELKYANDSVAKKQAIFEIESRYLEAQLRKQGYYDLEVKAILDVVKGIHEAEVGTGQLEAAQENYNKALGIASGLWDNIVAKVRAGVEGLNYVNSWQVGGTQSGGGLSYLGSQYAQYGAGRTAGEATIKQAQYGTGNILSTINPNFYKTAGTGGDGGGGGTSPAQQLEEYLQKIEQEVKLKRQQVGLSEQEARLAELRIKYEEAQIPVDEKRIESIAKAEEELRKATEAENKRTSMIQSFSNTIENALMSMVDGSQSVEDAFKGMLRNILLEIYRQQVAEPIATGIGSLLGGLFADGAAFRGGRVQAFATGGVVTSPTMFPMQGGAGLMGEAGPEAIMPLKRGPNGKLGVEMHGGSQPVVINQSFNFAANGDDSVKRIIAQAAPQIAQMTQKQIMDSRRRGGAMKATFS